MFCVVSLVHSLTLCHPIAFSFSLSCFLFLLLLLLSASLSRQQRLSCSHTWSANTRTQTQILERWVTAWDNVEMWSVALRLSLPPLFVFSCNSLCCVCRTVVDQALMELEDIFQHVTVTEIKLLIFFFSPGPLSLVCASTRICHSPTSPHIIGMFSNNTNTFVLFQGLLMLLLTIANLRCDYRRCECGISMMWLHILRLPLNKRRCLLLWMCWCSVSGEATLYIRLTKCPRHVLGIKVLKQQASRKINCFVLNLLVTAGHLCKQLRTTTTADALVNTFPRETAVCIL